MVNVPRPQASIYVKRETRDVITGVLAGVHDFILYCFYLIKRRGLQPVMKPVLWFYAMFFFIAVPAIFTSLIGDPWKSPEGEEV
jgi:hypothetical protein